MGKDNNFTKAVKELLGEKTSSSAQGAVQSAPQQEAAEPLHVGPRDVNYTADNQESSYRTPTPPPAAPVYVQPKPPVEDVTYITRDTVITGAINSKSSIKMDGQMTGDIETERDINVTGKVDGNIDGDNIVLNDGAVIGDLNGKSDVVIDSTAIVIGNINSETFDSDGRVKGSVKVATSVSLKSNAVVFGNITSKSLNVQDGAVLKGNVQIISPRSNDDDLFTISKKNHFEEIEG